MQADTFIRYNAYSSVQVKNITVILEREFHELLDFIEECKPHITNKYAAGYQTQGCGLYVAIIELKKRKPVTRFVHDTGNFEFPSCPHFHDLVKQQLIVNGVKVAYHGGRGD